MIGQLGIDSDVQNRMDAYRGNPQALMQRYAQGQELVDLLALQKLKSEKEAAARDMQMKMESAGLPTVAQQREQEVMDLTKKEVAQQAGLGGQQQALQQQNAMKQLMQAAGAPKPPSGMQQPQPNQPPTKAPGLPGLAAPNMMPPKAMASGGIIAFAGGGDTDEEEKYGTSARSGIARLMQYDPEVLGKRLGYTPAEREAEQRRIEDMRRYDEETMSPERRRSEGLARWLLGGAGKTTTGRALAGAGAASMDYQTRMDALKRQRMAELQGRERDITKADVAARSKGYELGIGALESATRTAGGLEEASIRASAANTPTEAYYKLQQRLKANPDYNNLVTQEKAIEKQLTDMGAAGAGSPVAQGMKQQLDTIRKQRMQFEESAAAQEGQNALIGLQIMRNAQSAGQGAAQSTSGTQFVVGKAYKDANGNTAVYKGKDASGKDIWE